MSWLDDLLTQITEASSDGGSAADAIPSEPAKDAAFVPGKDSSDASKFFETFFGREGAPDTSSMGAQGPEYGSAAKDSQRANDMLGLGPDFTMPAAAASKTPMSFLEGVAAKVGLKKTSSGDIDWSDPSTVSKAMQLIMAGGNIAGALINRGQPQGYKSAAQLRSEIAGPLNNWTPQQQASANAFFGKPMQGAAGHQLMFAADMPNPIVPGKGYAGGGSVAPFGSAPLATPTSSPLVSFSSASPSAAAYGMQPTAAMPSPSGVMPPQSAPAGALASATPPMGMHGPQGSPNGFIPRGPGGRGGMPDQFKQKFDPRPRIPFAGDSSTIRSGTMQANSLPPLNASSPLLDPTQQKVAAYGQSYGPNAYYLQPGINDYTAKLQSAQNSADLLNHEGSLNQGQAWTPDAISMLTSGQPMSYWQQQQSAFDAGQHPTAMRGGGRIGGFARGGALGHVVANTGGQDDVVPINAAGGEYMFDADTVSALGDGNNAAGARKLDAARENIRAHKRSAPKNKIPPRAKPLAQYMPKGAK